MVKAVRGLRLHLVRAFDELEHRYERTGPRARYTVDVWEPRRPVRPEWWPWWPPVGVTALSGPVALQVGWALGTAWARAARGEPVLLVAPVGMQRWVTDVLLAHAGVPLHLIGAGALRMDQWQRISRRLGALADAPISMMDPHEEPPTRYLPDTVVVAFCATFIYIYVNANCTSIMLRMNTRMENYRTRLRGVDSYLRRNKVSRELRKVSHAATQTLD